MAKTLQNGTAMEIRFLLPFTEFGNEPFLDSFSHEFLLEFNKF